MAANRAAIGIDFFLAGLLCQREGIHGLRTFVSCAPTYVMRRMRHNRVGAPGNDRIPHGSAAIKSGLGPCEL